MRRIVILTICICCTCLALAGGSALRAAEPIYRDLFVSLEVLPADFDFTIKRFDREATGDDSYDLHLGLTVGGRWSFTAPGSRHGLVVGIQGLAARGEYDFDSEHEMYGARATVGYGLGISDTVDLLVTPFAEVGITAWDFPSNQAFDGFDTTGDYTAWGASTHLMYTFKDHLRFELFAGYRDQSEELDGDDVAIEIEQGSFFGGLGISFRFSAAPPRLD